MYNMKQHIICLAFFIILQTATILYELQKKKNKLRKKNE